MRTFLAFDSAVAVVSVKLDMSECSIFNVLEDLAGGAVSFLTGSGAFGASCFCSGYYTTAFGVGAVGAASLISTFGDASSLISIFGAGGGDGIVACGSSPVSTWVAFSIKESKVSGSYGLFDTNTGVGASRTEWGTEIV